MEARVLPKEPRRSLSTGRRTAWALQLLGWVLSTLSPKRAVSTHRTATGFPLFVLHWHWGFFSKPLTRKAGVDPGTQAMVPLMQQHPWQAVWLKDTHMVVGVVTLNDYFISQDTARALCKDTANHRAPKKPRELGVEVGKGPSSGDGGRCRKKA